jgi:ABC-2 type transport system permease protein
MAWARVFSAYRAEVWLRTLLPVLQIFLLIELWSVAYGSRAEVSGVPRDAVMSYLTVVNLQLPMCWPVITRYVERQIREGKVAIEMLRPLAFPGQALAHQAGFVLSRLPPLVVVVPLAGLAGGLALPDTAAAGLLFPVSMVLAFAVNALLFALISMVAFWIYESGGLLWTVEMVAQFMSGAFVPLPLLPGGVRTLFEVLPFQAVGYTPAAVYCGMLAGPEAYGAVAVQVGWVLVLAALLALVWRRARRKVEVQGG